MVHQLKKGKFLVVFYGDSVSDLELYGKNLRVEILGSEAFFCLEISEEMDIKRLRNHPELLDTFVFEGTIISRRTAELLKENPSVKKVKLQLSSAADALYHVKRLKLQKNQVVFSTH